jgi:predicted nucleic acid-binding protein
MQFMVSMPVSRKRTLIDASSAILLAKTGLFRRLTEVYRVIMAQAVYDEITRRGYPGASDFAAARRAEEIRVLSPAGAAFPAAENALSGPGERETIRLYARGEGDFVIIDDRKGAGFCRSAGIPYINALLFPRILRLVGDLSEAEYRRRTGQLLEKGRYSARIVNVAAEASPERLGRFLPS